jgi:hypothetical protein
LSTRGSALMGPGPIRRRGAGCNSSKLEAAFAKGDNLGSVVACGCGCIAL